MGKVIETPNRGRPGHVELKPAGYLGELRKGKGPRLYVGRNGRRLSSPDPDPQEPNFTGRYEDYSSTYSFLVNQAGKRVECWLSPFMSAGSSGRRYSYLLGGDREGDGSFRVQSYPDGKIRARLWREGEHVKFQVEDGDVEILLRQEKRPTLSPHALPSNVKPSEIPWRFEWAPLRVAVVSLLRTRIHRLAPYVKSFFKSPSPLQPEFPEINPERLSDQSIKTAQHLFTELDEVFACNDVNATERDSARWLLCQFTRLERVRIKDSERSMNQWLQIVNNWLISYPKTNIPTELKRRMKVLRHLGITGATKYTYGVKLELHGMSFDAGIDIGKWDAMIEVRQLKPSAWPQPAKLKGVLYNIGLGLSVGVQVAVLTSGSALSSVEWAPADFKGPIKMTDLGVWGGAGESGAMSLTWLTFLGGRDSLHPPLEADLSGPADLIGVGAGLGGAVYQGSVKSPFRVPMRKDVKDAPPEYQVDAKVGTARHFDFGVALLRPEAIDLLRRFCAIELALLNQPNASVEIHGHADRPDTPERNDKLSTMRASNVEQAMKDILGLWLRAQITKVEGHGEEQAAKTDDPKQRNPAYRRVNVSICGRRALILWARGPR